MLISYKLAEVDDFTLDELRQCAQLVKFGGATVLTEQQIQQKLSTQFSTLAIAKTDDGQVISCVAVRLSYQMFSAEHIANQWFETLGEQKPIIFELSSIATHHTYKKRALASILCKMLLHRMRFVYDDTECYIFATTQESNAGSRRILTSLGFREHDTDGRMSKAKPEDRLLLYTAKL
jgi:ribosomal protein S18 acetylase RimI-like enzyme